VRQKRKVIHPTHQAVLWQGFKSRHGTPGGRFRHPAGIIQSMPMGFTLIATPNTLALNDLPEQQGPTIITTAHLKIDWFLANSATTRWSDCRLTGTGSPVAALQAHQALHLVPHREISCCRIHWGLWSPTASR
jgi:hypothetical protein